MGDLIQFLPFKLARRMAEAEAASLDVAQIALEGGPTIEIPMADVEAYRNAPEYLPEFGGRGSAMGPSVVEPPADCPA